MLPYKDLYIYEIPGEVSGSKSIFREDFLGCWNEGEVSFLFFSAPHDEEVEAVAKKKGYEVRSRNVLDYKSWQAGDELRPFQVGNLVICPAWENRDVKEGEVLIRLDPCVVFGTGNHPTTRTCLEALWEIYQKEKPKIVLDLGTGSGILALAAAKLGAERILAVDCNELAVETAARNVLLNGETRRIEVRQGWAEQFIEEEADLVCANLHSQIIEALLNKRGLFTKRWIVVSGIFVKDGEGIEKRLEEGFIQPFRRFQEKVWMTWVGFNRGVGSLNLNGALK
jgi:ribosomal protein L11 methyltransferase